MLFFRLSLKLFRTIGGNKCINKFVEIAVKNLIKLIPVSYTHLVFSGRVSISDSFIYIPTGILGAVIGAFILKKIPDKWIRRLFGIFLIWAGIRLFLR